MGQITLSARDTGSEVIIEIIDDGRGVDDQAVLKKAIRQGIASPDVEYSHKEILNFLLAPGADFDLLRAAVGNAEARELPYHVGGVFTADMFYNQSTRINEKCRDLGLLAIDMETAGLYWEAMACGKRALSILTVSNHILREEETPAAERQNAFTDMMELALDTAWEFAE